jgi:hypothetical protein
MLSTRHRLRRPRPGEQITIVAKPPIGEATLHAAIMPLMQKLLVGKPATEANAGVLHLAIKRDMKTNPVYVQMRDWTPIVVIDEATGKVSVFFTAPPDHEKKARH